jgi:hypothetical protein
MGGGKRKHAIALQSIEMIHLGKSIKLQFVDTLPSQREYVAEIAVRKASLSCRGNITKSEPV